MREYCLFSQAIPNKISPIYNLTVASWFGAHHGHVKADIPGHLWKFVVNKEKVATSCCFRVKRAGFRPEFESLSYQSLTDLGTLFNH